MAVPPGFGSRMPASSSKSPSSTSTTTASPQQTYFLFEISGKHSGNMPTNNHNVTSSWSWAISTWPNSHRSP
eukprot:4776908-Pyramimonas_sp.AAC.1